MYCMLLQYYYIHIFCYVTEQSGSANLCISNSHRPFAYAYFEYKFILLSGQSKCYDHCGKVRSIPQGQYVVSNIIGNRHTLLCI